MRVQRKANNKDGKTATILTHSNNTLHLKLDSGEKCYDLYWSWTPLDDEAKKYIAEVEANAIPLLSYFND